MNTPPRLAFIFILFILAAFLGGTSSLHGQTTKELDMLRDAETFLSKEKYDSAAIMYEELIKTNKYKFEYIFLAGYCYYSSSERKKNLAIERFEKILKYRRTNEFPETYFYLARCYQLTNRFDEATKNYNEFMKYIENTKSGRELRAEINSYLKSTFLAETMASKNDGKMTITNLGKEINTKYDEYNPIISNDQLSMVYVSKKPKQKTDNKDYTYYFYYNPNKDIYLSERSSPSDSIWTSIKSIGNQIHINPSTLEVGESHILFQENEYGDLNLINSKNDTVYISMNDKTNGFGGKDIYLAIKKDDGSLTNLTNLGSTINSDQDEVSPFYDYTNRTLYYSTTNFSGLGGFDIYKSSFNESNGWSKPINIGYPINTPLDDFNFILSTDGTKAWYSSGKEDGFGGLDIYYVEFKQGQDIVFVTEPEIKPTVITPILDTATSAPETVGNIVFNDNSRTNIVNFEEPVSLKSYLSKKIVNANEGLDTIYVVQVGAYRKNISVSYFKGFKEVVGLLKQDQIFRYYVVPTFNSVSAANTLRNSAIALGYQDAFVTTILFD